MKEGIKRGLALLSVMAVLMLAGCTQNERTDIPELIEPAGVRRVKVQAYTGEIYRVTAYEAQVSAYVQTLSFACDGRAGAVHGYAGKQVESGEVLIELNQEALRERIQKNEDEAEYLSRDGAYADALIELDIELLRTELRQLQANRADEVQMALKKNEIKQKEAQLRQNRSLREVGMTALQEKINQDRSALEEGLIKAPFSGVIVYAGDIAQGDKVSAYDPIFKLMDEHRTWIECAYIPEGVLGAADFVYAQVGAERYEVKALPIDEQERMNILLSGGELTSRFKAAEDENLTAGQYAAVYVVSDYVKEALIVPSAAVYSADGGYYVYADEDGTRVRRTVRIGVMTDSKVQILEGIGEGEWVYVPD